MLPKIELLSQEEVKADPKSEGLVLGWFQEEGDKKNSGLVYKGKSSGEIEKLLQHLNNSKHFSAKKAEAGLLRFYSLEGAQNVGLLGLGKQQNYTSEVARTAGAALFQLQKREKIGKFSLKADGLFSFLKGEDLSHFFQAFCEGYLLASYEFPDFKTLDKAAPKFQVKGLEIIAGRVGGDLKESLNTAVVFAECMSFARRLGDHPSNEMTPTLLARQIEGMAKRTTLKFLALNKSQIEKEKMGLLLGVSQGSEEEPRFIILEHRGGKKNDKPIVFIGKGVTFDSGGISIKPAASMEEMKYDMMGAATVAGVLQAVNALKLPMTVIGLIPATENLPSGTAQKPGDIKTSITGKTVEIINTDAEGRLILADALEYARKFEPQAMVDIATLTGAVSIALGSVATGIMGNNPQLISALKQAAEQADEKVWELPLFEEYEEDMKSSVADYRNAGTREAGSSKGGTFLKFFVEKGTPWVHCDIGGTAYHRKDVNYHPAKNASGALIRSLVYLVKNWKGLKA